MYIFNIRNVVRFEHPDFTKFEFRIIYLNEKNIAINRKRKKRKTKNTKDVS